jgi:hypothetical protein
MATAEMVIGSLEDAQDYSAPNRRNALRSTGPRTEGGELLPEIGFVLDFVVPNAARRKAFRPQKRVRV